MDDLTREFLIESSEGLDAMERSLTELELRPSDPELLGQIFRAVHTIKGTTGFLGFHRLESLAHSGENVLGLLREGKFVATADVITLLLQVLDGLRVILRQIEASGEDGTADPAMDGVLIAALNKLTAPPSEEISLPDSVAAFADDVAKAVIAADTVKSRTRKKSDTKKSKVAEEISAQTSSPDEIPEVSPLMQLVPVLVAAPQEILQPADLEPTPAAPTAITAAAESTLRVDVEVLNRMMNLVGELVLTRNQILQHNSSDQGFNMLARRLDMVTADLRESVMKARMQPVSNIFQKFPRMLRDLCHICNKQVQLEMHGQETELDKSLLEAIKDPLIHAVRNSIDHGVETAEERIAAGKSAEGTLRLRAYQEGSHVLIEVMDDGRGMDPQKILSKAIDKGLVSQERGSKLSEGEILKLIFLPGFSTAEKVTNVSGRGVGMDVVRTNVEKIGGKVELESTLGIGTTLRLRIPLTLAIIPALVVRSCGETFAIPQGALFELVYVAANEVENAIEWVDNAPVYRLRGSLLPVVQLGELLKLKEIEKTSKKFFMAVLDADGKRFGLVVDELLDPEEIVVKPLSAVLREVGLFSGATILGNGSLALILDPSAAAAQANIGQRKMTEDNATRMQADVAALGPEYLVFNASSGNERARRTALPLETVERIETVTYGQIEYAGNSAVLQYFGGVLPLVDEGGLLEELAVLNSELAVETPVHILVCHYEGWSVGLVVREVLDVSRGKEFENAGANSGMPVLHGRIARIGDRVTVLQNLEQIREQIGAAGSAAQNVIESPAALMEVA